MNYYNDNNPYCAQWLRNLISNKLLPNGDVDDRSILEVSAKDLRSYTQCHFFAGIGGWPYALRLAGWGKYPVWTGSCPCQPFSVTGYKQGFKDERHLWPVWLALIKECNPPIVFGEQVASATYWFERLYRDLEGVGYSVGYVRATARWVGACHKRNRLWFVADTEDRRVGSLQNSFKTSGGRPRKRFGRPGRPEVARKNDGIPYRMDTLQAFGNAIVPQVAAQFITAFMEISP